VRETGFAAAPFACRATDVAEHRGTDQRTMDGRKERQDTLLVDRKLRGRAHVLAHRRQHGCTENQPLPP
jgi:hypothetical protein